MRDSAKWRVVIGEMNTKWYDAQREAARQLEEAVRPWNPTNLALYWKNANEDNLMEHLIFCALTPQTKVETLERILEDQFVTRNAGFRGMSESQISEELKSGGVRFPRNKARQIRELMSPKLSIHAHHGGEPIGFSSTSPGAPPIVNAFFRSSFREGFDFPNAGALLVVIRKVSYRVPCSSRPCASATA